MCDRTESCEAPQHEHFATAEEIAELMGVSARMVRMLPIKQVRIGPRTIRYRLSDVYDYLNIDNPNL